MAGAVERSEPGSTRQQEVAVRTDAPGLSTAHNPQRSPATGHFMPQAMKAALHGTASTTTKAIRIHVLKNRFISLLAVEPRGVP